MYLPSNLPSNLSSNYLLTLFLAFLLTVSLPGCGKKGTSGLTKVRFNTSFALLPQAVQSGGVIIYGVNSEIGKSVGISLANDSAITEIYIPNGNWKFYAVGWTGTSTMEGDTRCGTRTELLNGTEKEIIIEINATSCDTDFTNPDYLNGTNFLPMKIMTCPTLTGISSAASTCNFDPYITKSVRVKLITYSAGNLGSAENLTGSLSSACQEMNTSQQNTNLVLPFGPATNNPFYTVIEAYSSTNCTGTPETYTYPSGVRGNRNTSTAQVYTDSSYSIFFLLKTPSNYDDYGLSGTYYIYNANQLNDIGASACGASACDADFKLMSNINMAGVNFNMIGSSINITNLSLGTYTSSNPYTGTFDGNDKTISNVTVSLGSTNGVGIFGSIGHGTTGAGTVQNLKLQSINITGQKAVGGLAGANKGTLTNIEGISGTVSSDDYFVGGLVGINFEVDTTNKGIVEKSYSSNNVSGLYGIGGLVGMNADGATIQNTYSTGTVSASFSSAGGLVGENSESNIWYSYTIGSVSAASNAGGFVGEENVSTPGSQYVACLWDSSLVSLGWEGGTSDLCANSVTGQICGYSDLKANSEAYFTGGDWSTEWSVTDGYYPTLN